MLLKCTECGHDVSDKAEKCLNCGCPVSEIVKCLQNSEENNGDDISDINSESEDSENSIFCNINGKRTNITWIKDIIEGLSETEFYHYKYVWFHNMRGPKEQAKCLNKYAGTPEIVFYDAACKLCFKVRDKCNLSYYASRRFLYGLVESNFELEEFYGESETENREKIRRSLPPQVKCPYCGSYDTKKIFFRGGRAQKQWLCNNCRSKF